MQINSSPSRIRTTLSKATGGLRKLSIGGGQAAQEAFFQAGPAYDNSNQTATPTTLSPQQTRDSYAGVGAGGIERPSHSFANVSQSPSFSNSGALNGVRATKKRISIDMVSAPRPESFVHAAHASDADQAEEILRRWGRDGVGKIADPLWVEPIKEALRQQALRNQAEAIAQIQANLHQESVIREGGRELHIMNGAPSVTTTNSQMTMNTAKGTAGHSELSATSPVGGGNQNAGGFFEGIREEMRGSDGEARDSPLSSTSRPQQQQAPSPRKSPNTIRPPAPAFPRSNTAGTMVINPTPEGGTQALDYMAYKPLENPHDKPSNQGKDPKRDSKAIDGLPGGAGIAAMFDPPQSAAGNNRPESMLVRESQANNYLPTSMAPPPPPQAQGESAGEETINQLDLNIRPSLQTVEKSVAAKIFFENLYYGILKKPRARDTRRQGLEAELAQLRIPESSKNEIRAAWAANETEYLRDLRARVNVNSFAKLKTIGHGAFGVVALCRERGTGGLFAMKQLRKADMLRKGQEGHVRAERDLMTSASSASNARWIVKLVYSFQDVDHLYLIMEFMGGGDLLNLLIEKDIFAEDFAKFYVAEMILSIHEAHRLGYIHRDIKPDNFLFTSEGHVKLADFGLCQSFHWAHDGAYYDQQRKNLLKKHGIDLDDAGGRRARAPSKANQSVNNKRLSGNGNALNEKELNDVMSDRNEDGTPMTHVLTWRDKNKKKIAYSVVGTNNYMAPEVLRGLGYDQSCDWWSLGVIVFEMLYGYPPFVSKSRHLTRQKILNHKQTLKFPPKPKVSRDAQDFILSMICEKEDRLGSQSTASVSRPNSMLQGARRSGFVPNQNGPGPGGVGGLSDGVDEIMNHPWLRGIDWNNIHRLKAPFKPALSHPADTKHFEDDIEDEPLPAPGAAEAGPNAPVEQPRDPMLRDKAHGQHLLEMRKQLAFVVSILRELEEKTSSSRRRRASLLLTFFNAILFLTLVLSFPLFSFLSIGLHLQISKAFRSKNSIGRREDCSC